MRKLLFIILIQCSILAVKAENEREYYPPVSISYFDNWFSGYPVITGFFGMNYIESISINKHQDSLEDLLYCAITTINDEPTKGKHPSEIRNMFMASDTVQLVLRKKRIRFIP